MKPKRTNCSFRFRAEELEIWRRAAELDRRSLTSWIALACTAYLRRRDQNLRYFSSGSQALSHDR